MRFGVKHFSFRSALSAALLSLYMFSSQAVAGPIAGKWVGSWASAQIAVDTPNALSASALKDSTLRQLVRLSDGGARLRVRISNAFGTSPLTVSDADVALAKSPASSAIDRRSDHPLTFSGARSVIIPAGAEYDSDPVSMNVPALATLAVSIHYADLPKIETGHPGSRATSYVAPGDQVTAAELRSETSVERWYYLTGIDVEPSTPSEAIAVLGDSITDGHGVQTNSNARWTDTLTERLKALPAFRALAVLNLGIGGNRVVEDGIGPNAAARFGRDVLERSGVRYLIILEGVNDLGVLTRDKPAAPEQHATMVARILTGYEQMIQRAHERGIKVIGATIMPFAASGYYHPGPATEADRQRINAWICSRGHFDALVDFDALMRDPQQPGRLRKDYDSGDGLHPSAAGYRAMGEAVPLSLFAGAGR